MESPFGPQRHNSSMLQLYRKRSDMTARVITPPVEGTSDLWGMERSEQVGGGGKGFPALLKGEDPIFHPLFLRNHRFFLREKTCGKFLRFLLVLVTLVGCPACSSILFSFYSTLGCHVCFHPPLFLAARNYDPKAGEIS